MTPLKALSIAWKVLVAINAIACFVGAIYVYFTNIDATETRLLLDYFAFWIYATFSGVVFCITFGVEFK